MEYVPCRKRICIWINSLINRSGGPVEPREGPKKKLKLKAPNSLRKFQAFFRTNPPKEFFFLRYGTSGPWKIFWFVYYLRWVGFTFLAIHTRPDLHLSYPIPSCPITSSRHVVPNSPHDRRGLGRVSKLLVYFSFKIKIKNLSLLRFLFFKISTHHFLQYVNPYCHLS